MDMKIILGFVLVVALGTTTAYDEFDTQEALYRKLFTNYNTNLAPTKNLTVKFGIALLDVDFDLPRNRMITTMWNRMVWVDPRLQWDKEQFNVSVLRVPMKLVWMPDVVIYNGKELSFTPTNVLVYPSGQVLVVPPAELETRCDLTDFYKGEQSEVTCLLKFGSWTRDGYTMDLQLYDAKEEADVTDYDGIKFDITSNKAKRISKFYDCCPEPYISLEYTLGIKPNPKVPFRGNADMFRYNQVENDIQFKLKN